VWMGLKDGFAEIKEHFRIQDIIIGLKKFHLLMNDRQLVVILYPSLDSTNRYGDPTFRQLACLPDPGHTNPPPLLFRFDIQQLD
jgi:hypothetical protein